MRFFRRWRDAGGERHAQSPEDSPGRFAFPSIHRDSPFAEKPLIIVCSDTTSLLFRQDFAFPSIGVEKASLPGLWSFFPSMKKPPGSTEASIVLLPLSPAFAEGLGPDADEPPRLGDAPNPGRGWGRSIRVMQGKGGPKSCFLEPNPSFLVRC